MTKGLTQKNRSVMETKQEWPFMHNKVKLSQYPAIHTNYMLYHCTTLYNIIIIFDTVDTVRQKRNFKHKIYSTQSLSPSWYSGVHQQGLVLPGQRVQHTSMVGNVKIALYERSYYCYINV